MIEQKNLIPILSTLMILNPVTILANKTEEKTQYRILSIDGGGMRGIMPAMFLRELSKRTGQAPHEMFDLIAGTSIGGILALGYAEGEKAPDEFVKLFELHGKDIFHASKRRRLSTGFGHFDARYSSTNLEGVLKEYFGEERYLSDITKTDAMVVAHDAGEDHPAVFKTWSARQMKSHDLKIWEAARGTSAAPTYFKPFKVKYRDESEHTLLDGGLSLNNPAMCAYTEMVHLHKDLIYEPSRRGHKKSTKAGVEFLVVSLGTGNFTQTLNYDNIKKQSSLAWLNPVLHISMDTKPADYHMSCLLPEENYYRWNPDISQDISQMDDTRPETVKALKKCARSALKDYEPQMQALVEELTLPTTPQSPRRTKSFIEEKSKRMAHLKNIFSLRKGVSLRTSTQDDESSQDIPERKKMHPLRTSLLKYGAYAEEN